MTWLRNWWKRLDGDRNTEEAKAALERADVAGPEIERLGAELRRLQRANHFSPLVQAAIRRAAEERR